MFSASLLAISVEKFGSMRLVIGLKSCSWIGSLLFVDRLMSLLFYFLDFFCLGVYFGLSSCMPLFLL